MRSRLGRYGVERTMLCVLSLCSGSEYRRGLAWRGAAELSTDEGLRDAATGQDPAAHSLPRQMFSSWTEEFATTSADAVCQCSATWGCDRPHLHAPECGEGTVAVGVLVLASPGWVVAAREVQGGGGVEAKYVIPRLADEGIQCCAGDRARCAAGTREVAGEQGCCRGITPAAVNCGCRPTRRHTVRRWDSRGNNGLVIGVHRATLRSEPCLGRASGYCIFIGW